MTRVVFFIHNEWAFGSIHYELCRYLAAYDIDAQVLSWEVSYTKQEISELDAVTDVYVTIPQGYKALREAYDVKPKKIVIITHALGDLHYLRRVMTKNEFAKLYGFAVVSEFLRKAAQKLDITKNSKIALIGINTKRFKHKPSTELKTVGYASIFHRVDSHVGKDLKRGYLVERCAREAGLEFKVAADYHNSFVTMPGFYPTVDCIIIASTEEGAGLPALEAGAAGRLVISTPVGHWKERISEKGGVEVPMDEDEFVKETVRILKFYKDNPKDYQKKCVEVQKHAKSYDWKYVIKDWAELLK